MIKIYQIGNCGYLSGIKEIEDTAGCDLNWTRTIPPVLNSGEFAKFIGNKWIKTTIPYSEFPISLRNIQDKKLEELANIRFNKEASGIIVNDIKINTDLNSQSKISGAFNLIQINPNVTINWKINSSSWIELNADQIKNISLAVATHIQNCFNNEKSLAERINNCNTVDELNSIDLNSGW